ncbi:hypothetical protein FD755_011134 [Muntiacus reevesi]|uniref:Calponin-2 n=1 Tax=Muntiacus reevesi TaxID=9886 RepID=A0A5N3XRX9_MUNRE|nr:hypothetical protein FD755_011134 [Muntiacus reevesi]
MNSTQFNKGPSHRLSAEVKNRLHLSIGLDFQKGLKDWIILDTLMNKLQLGSIPKTNCSMQKWQQPENLFNFIKVMVSYGMNPVNLFEAGKLSESGNLMQVPLSCPGQEGQDKCVIGFLMGTYKCASQSGMTASSTRWHLYDPKNHILTPWDHLTISLQMGTNKCDSQHIYNTKLGTDKCDNSPMSLQVAFGLGRQIYDPKYRPPAPVADVAPATAGEGQAQGSPQSTPSTTGGGRLLRHPCGLSSHITDLSGFLGFSVFLSCFPTCQSATN